MDGGYGNNSSFLENLESLDLSYIGGFAKNRQVSVINQKTGKKQSQKRLDEIIFSLEQKDLNTKISQYEKDKVSEKYSKLEKLEDERDLFQIEIYYFHFFILLFTNIAFNNYIYIW